MAEMEEQTLILEALEQGTIELEGLIPWGSNYTFLVEICYAEEILAGVYKPRQGERPLWDFARGTLCQRERAAYLLSELLGWHLVPPTILRQGPHGEGSLQYFIEHDPDIHYMTLSGQHAEQARRIALFDALANNADRKSGHVLLESGTERLWAIDHGVCFHTEPKLRTVIWDFAGQPLPPSLLADLQQLNRLLTHKQDEIGYLSQLQKILTRAEMDALQQRLQRIIQSEIFPQPGPGRHYPWPLV